MTPNFGSNFDEHKWVINIRRSLDEELGYDDIEAPVSIFSVPKTLISSSPDCYTPQHVAISPYHYWRPELYEMERYKVDAAKRTQKQLQYCHTFQDLVEQLEKLEPRIRACYHKYLDLNAETLDWMMAISASFLLDFLQVYVHREMSDLVGDHAGVKSARNWILRDVVMLENQIPLFVLRKVLEIQFSSLEAADDISLSMLRGLCQELSPFKTMENLPEIVVSNCPHVLHFLYHMLVPGLEKLPSEPVIQQPEEQKEISEEKEGTSVDSSSNLKQLLSKIWEIVSTINSAPIRLIRAALQSRPVRVIVKFPWKILSNLPGFSFLIKPIEYLFFFKDMEEEIKPVSSNFGIHKPPLAEEIAIPSVSELSKAGVRILPTNGNISTITFDVKTVTLYLPVISLDINTEVVLRNLVAYEATTATGPLVFTRYTELMNGIIDTEEDVKLLREKGIVQNHLKSDKEAADLWNGMSKSIRLTKVPFLDKVIEDVNRYYNGRWNVKLANFIKQNVYCSWQFLTLLATIMLLLLMTFQAFCSVYGCSRTLRIQTSD
ncbi:hypothetical protein PTKIN_Ptkin13bG0141200 [Pterospermum kingtungense]